MNESNEIKVSKEVRGVGESSSSLAATLEAHAMKACALIEEVLKTAPLRRTGSDGAQALGLVLDPQIEEALREMCQVVAAVDGHTLDDDALLVALALAVMRGPKELARFAVEEERRLSQQRR